MSAEILQKYVTKLGYQIDTASARKFLFGMSAIEKAIFAQKERLSKIDKKILTEKNQGIIRSLRMQKNAVKNEINRLQKIDNMTSMASSKVEGLTAGMVALSAATVVATAKYSEYMRKLYSTSELTGTTVVGAKGMELVSKGLGMNPEEYAATAKNVYQGIVGNPAIKQLTEQLTGLRATGKNTEEVLWGITDAAQKMSKQEWAQIRWAEAMGVPQEMFLLMKSHPEIKERQEEAKKTYEDWGIDPEQSKEMFKEYGHQIDIIGTKFEALGYVIMSSLSDPIKDIFKDTNEWLDGLPDKINRLKSNKSFWWELIPGMDQIPDEMDKIRTEKWSADPTFKWIKENIPKMPEYKIEYSKSTMDNINGSKEYIDGSSRYISRMMEKIKPAVDESFNFLDFAIGMEIQGAKDFMAHFSEPSSGSMKLTPMFQSYNGGTQINPQSTSPSVTNITNNNNITNNIHGQGAEDIAIKSTDRTLESLERNLHNPFSGK